MVRVEAERYGTGRVGLRKYERLERVHVLPQSCRDGGAGKQQVCLKRRADGHIVKHHDGVFDKLI